MSSQTQSQIDSAKQRIESLTARAKQAEASLRAELVAAYHAEEAEWDLFYAGVDRDLTALAAEIERAEDESFDDLEAEADLVTEDVDRAIEAIDSRLGELEQAMAAKEDGAAQRAKGPFESLRKLRDEAFGSRSDADTGR
jgi:hypothetical protein